jgi:hypothetical protein
VFRRPALAALSSAGSRRSSGAGGLKFASVGFAESRCRALLLLLQKDRSGKRGGAGWLIGRQILTARAVEADLREVERLQQQSAFPEAGAVLQRAQSRLAVSLNCVFRGSWP